MQIKLELTAFNLGQVQDIVDNVQQMDGAGFNNLYIFLMLRITLLSGQQIDKTDNTVERCPDFMAHVGQEDRFGLTGLLGLLMRLFQLGDVFLGRKIMGNFALLIAQR